VCRRDNKAVSVAFHDKSATIADPYNRGAHNIEVVHRFSPIFLVLGLLE
jgi:hypothetical protein